MPSQRNLLAFGSGRPKKKRRAYRIPSEEAVVEAVRKVMKKHPVVRSQYAMTALVLEQLWKERKGYRISDKRLRKIILGTNEVHVSIRYKATRMTSLNHCPVCGSDVRRLEGVTVEGRREYIGYRCTFCRYRTGYHVKLPTRYIFRRR